MGNSASSGNILGYASGTQPGLVSTTAQTFAGKKTLDGGAAIKGDTSGSAIAAGYVGELKTASGTRTFNVATGTSQWLIGTLSTGSGIVLTAGVWIIGFSSELTSSSAGSITVTNIILTSDSTDGSPSNNTSASATTTSAGLGNVDGFTTTGSIKGSFCFVNISAQTTYTTKILATYSGFTGTLTSRLFAYRIA